MTSRNQEEGVSKNADDIGVNLLLKILGIGSNEGSEQDQQIFFKSLKVKKFTDLDENQFKYSLHLI